MTQKKAIIVKSPTPPTNTEVLWQDLSSDPPQLKSFINGGWKQLNSESTEVTDLRNELNASINEVNSTLNDKIDTNASTLNDKIDTSVDALNDKIDDEIAAQTETSQGIQEDLDGTKTRVATLENTYEDTMNIANQQINELIEGKAQIAQALTDRGYPTQPTDSSASMAQKIENMSYDAGWLAQIGYSEQNDGGVKDAVAYSKSIEDGWDAQVTNRNFQNDTKLVFCPRIDTSRYTSMNNFFAGSSLIFMKENDIDMSSVTTAQSMFSATRIAVIPPLSTPLLSGMYMCFNGASVRKIMSLDLSSMPTPSFGNGVENTEYCVLKNIGKVSNFNWNEANMSNWGNYSEDNRQSLVKTLRDYSFDRVTAGYSACTIKLHADTLARLTAEEIAAITAKGFTLTA